jgi:hypothetical protein
MRGRDEGVRRPKCAGATSHTEQGLAVVDSRLEVDEVSQFVAEGLVHPAEQFRRGRVILTRVALADGRDADRVSGSDSGEDRDADGDVDRRAVLRRDDPGNFEVLLCDAPTANCFRPGGCPGGQLLRAQDWCRWPGVARSRTIDSIGTPSTVTESSTQEPTTGSSRAIAARSSS